MAKNFALNSVYADYSSEGNRPYGPSVGTGPTVLLPIGLIFAVGGVSIPLARLFVAAYSLAALIALYLLGRRLMDGRLALLTVLLLVSTPGLELWFYARAVMGEMPGLLFLFLGLWLWLRAEPAQTRRLLLVGMLLGLASITKNQYAVVILPALFFAWLADLVWYRQRGWRYFVLPGLIGGALYAIWLVLILVVLGGEAASANVRATAATSSYVLLAFRTGEALEFLISRGVYGFVFFPALAYGIWLSRACTRAGQDWGLITIVVVVSTLFYLTSLAWPRYAFLPVALGSLLVARLVYDITGSLRLNWPALTDALRGRLALRPLIGWVVVGLTVIYVAYGLFTYVRSLRGTFMSYAYQAAEYLNAHVPLDATLETWEQELAALTDHSYHYPPQWVDAELGREDIFGLPEGSVSARATISAISRMPAMWWSGQLATGTGCTRRNGWPIST